MRSYRNFLHSVNGYLNSISEIHMNEDPAKVYDLLHGKQIPMIYIDRRGNETKVIESLAFSKILETIRVLKDFFLEDKMEPDQTFEDIVNIILKETDEEKQCEQYIHDAPS
jgi:hypothetical protein